ncbi:MAG: hypothetical protein QOE06_2644, partial [Thermoleophilaceae bacterium]|nr:hypothetical protein [Thermoleophilaceae bacterium]
ISGKRALLAFPDNSHQTYPWFNFAARDGALWDPYQFGGHSFVGELQTALFYPLNHLLFLVTGSGVTARGITAFLIVHMIMAAVFMYAFLRVIGLVRPGAVVGALAFAMGGYMVHRLPSQANIFAAATWVPLVFCLVHVALTRAAWVALPAGGALGMSVLAGHIQPAGFAILALVAYAAWFAAFTPPRGAAALRAAGVVAVTVAVGGSLAAVQLIPSVEYQDHAVRFLGDTAPAVGNQKLPYDVIGHHNLLDPDQLDGFLSPAFAPEVSDGFPYIGILTLLLAIVGLARAPRRWAVFWAGLALLSLLYAMGYQAGVHRAAYDLIPLIDKLREPVRALMLTHFALAVLAGYGASALSERRPAWPARPAAPLALRGALAAVGLAAVAIVLAKAVDGKPLGGHDEGVQIAAALAVAGLAIVAGRALGWLTPAAAGALCVAVLVLDLVPFGQATVGEAAAYDGRGNFEPHRYYAENDVIRFLRTRPGVFRVSSPDAVIPIESGDVHHLEMLQGKGASMTQDLFDLFGLGGAPPSRVHDMMNVRYAVTKNPVEGWKLVFGLGAAQVYENPSALPRAWLAGRAEVVPDRRRAIELATSPQFPLRESVVLGSAPRTPPSPAAAAGAVRVVRRDPTHIEFESRAPAAGVLVASEFFYPGWTARVDGSRRPIVRADGVLRAVEVPPGVHRVAMSYRPTHWTLALLLSLGAAAAIAGACAAAAVRRRRPRT